LAAREKQLGCWESKPIFQVHKSVHRNVPNGMIQPELQGAIPNEVIESKQDRVAKG
jgi:hypothetical protein